MQTRVASDSPLEMVGSLWRRRKWLGILTLVAVFAAIASVVAGLPDLYRSSAVVVVEQPYISESFARSSIAGELEPRLQVMSQEILSRARLLDLINRFNLYPELRERVAPEVLVERMRKDIRLERKEVAHQGGRGVIVGFTLSYQGWDPEVVAQVTNTLASFYSSENQKFRLRQAADTTTLLRERLEDSKRKLEAAAAGIRIPESAPLLYSDPALERLNQARQDQFDRLAKMKLDLAGLRTHYGEKYPDVIRLRAEIESLESRIRTEYPNGTQEKLRPIAPNSVQEAFRREQELQQRMPRDYAALKEIHSSLMKRYEDAQLAETLERQRGEQFRILDVALPATEPSAPARARFLLMGLVLALGMAAAVMFIAERLDTSFRRLDELRSFAQLPILATIPRIVTAADIWRARLRAAGVAIAFTLAIILIVRGSYELGQAGEQLVWMFAQRSA